MFNAERKPMNRIYTCKSLGIFLASLLTCISGNLLYAQCGSVPAEIDYTSDGGGVSKQLNSAFSPADQSRLDGDEYAFAVSPSGVQVGEVVCITQRTDGFFLFNRIPITYTTDCYFEFFPGFREIDVNPDCLNDRSLTALQLTDQTGQGNYEGYFFVVYDPDNGGEFFLITGPNGDPFSSASTTGFFPESASNPTVNPADTDDNPMSRPVPQQGSTSFAALQTALPVTFIAFSARVVENVVKLSWSTATEDSNAGFEVQRALGAGEFSTIGRVAGAGTSYVINNYSFTDDNPRSGNNYYRLKQIDLDGAFTYSAIVQVRISKPVKDEVRIFPNPTSMDLNLTIGSDWEYPLLSVIDANGRVIREFKNVTPGTTSALSLDGLPPAIYQLRISDVSHTTTHRIVKQ